MTPLQQAVLCIVVGAGFVAWLYTHALHAIMHDHGHPSEETLAALGAAGGALIGLAILGAV